MTSATPPSLTKGTASVLTIKILKRLSFMLQPSCKGGSTATSFFSLLSYHAKQNPALPRRDGGRWDDGWGRLRRPGRGTLNIFASLVRANLPPYTPSSHP